MLYEITLHDICFARNENDKYIFKNLNMHISRDNGIIIILGSSGLGKSTFLYLLNGFLLAESGFVRVNEIEIRKGVNFDFNKFRTTMCSLMFQHYPLVNWLTCKENLLLVTDNMDKIDYYLDYLGVLGIKNKYTANISFGQRQRVSLIQTLLAETGIKLLDEPTSALGNDNKYNIIELIKKNSVVNNNLIIIATHDRDICGYANEIYKIQNQNVKKIK